VDLHLESLLPLWMRTHYLELRDAFKEDLEELLSCEPRGTLQNRPMRDTSKPANETESGQELLYLVGDRSGN
jgi:hypothetical protein